MHGACVIRTVSKNLLGSALTALAIAFATASAARCCCPVRACQIFSCKAFAREAPLQQALPTLRRIRRRPMKRAPGQPVSDLVIDLAGWIIATQDDRGLPFAVIDKAAAQILIFDAAGKVKGIAPRSCSDQPSATRQQKASATASSKTFPWPTAPRPQAASLRATARQRAASARRGSTTPRRCRSTPC